MDKETYKPRAIDPSLVCLQLDCHCIAVDQSHSGRIAVPDWSYFILLLQPIS